MKFTIITPVYNGVATIKQTIESVINQRDIELEYLIIDALSNDGTSELIKKFQDNRIIHILEKDNGLYDAMNKGIMKSSGEIIGIINADDYYYPGVLVQIANCFEQNRSIDIVHGNVLSIHHNGSYIARPRPISFINYTMGIQHPACFVKKNTYEKIGTFDLQFKISSDYDFFLRALLRHNSFYHLNKILAGYRRGGISDKNRCKLFYEQFQIRKKNRCKHVYLIGAIVLIYGILIRPFLISIVHAKSVIKRKIGSTRIF